MATRHECSNRARLSGNHTAGNGTPKRKRCAYCGSSFVILHGRWGVFVHSSVSGDNRYRADSAVSLHATERAAEAVVSADTTGTLVTRWVTESER